MSTADELARDLAENGLRCDLTPTMPAGNVGDLYVAFCDYLRQIDQSIRNRASEVTS